MQPKINNLFEKKLTYKQKIMKIDLNSVTATKLHQKMEIRMFPLPDGLGMRLDVDSDCRLPVFQGGLYHLIKCN